MRRRHDGGGRTETIYDFKMMKMTLIAYFGYLSLCHSVYGVVNEPRGTENTNGGGTSRYPYVCISFVRSFVTHSHSNMCPVHTTMRVNKMKRGEKKQEEEDMCAANHQPQNR